MNGHEHGSTLDEIQESRMARGQSPPHMPPFQFVIFHAQMIVGS
jgi:hypothetical protein